MKNKKRGKSKKIIITLSNRWLYTLITIGIIIILSVIVYAYGTTTPSSFGHSLNEIQRCAEGEILKVSGGVWGCDVGTISETDPTVQTWAKDDTQDIVTYGKVTIMRNYRYDWDMGLFTSSWPNPRCPCDTDQNARGNCYTSVPTYTNIDVGSICYDWFYSNGQYADGHRKTSGGPWIVKTLEYEFP